MFTEYNKYKCLFINKELPATYRLKLGPHNPDTQKQFERRK